MLSPLIHLDPASPLFKPSLFLFLSYDHPLPLPLAQCQTPSQMTHGSNPSSLHPRAPLLTALQKRLHASTTHLTALAEVYKQRSAIEQAYAEGLSKLAREAEGGRLSGKGGNEWERGSGEAKIWESVVSEIQEVSSVRLRLSVSRTGMRCVVRLSRRCEKGFEVTEARARAHPQGDLTSRKQPVFLM